MGIESLSEGARQRLEIMFDAEHAPAASKLLIHEWGNNLPFLEELNADELERFRFAALKLSEGRLDELRKAVELAKTDWRDMLMAAGFGHDNHSHERWVPAPRL